jgi:hypothetical protein
VIHIGITDDIDKITLFPAPPLHVGTGNGEKIMYHKAPSLGFILFGNSIAENKELVDKNG